MKILILRTASNKLNANTYNLQEIGLAKALVNKGHICDVVYSNGRNDDFIEIIELDNGKTINVIWLKCFNVFGEGIFPGLKKYINQYDVIQIGGYVGLNSVWLNRKLPGKVVNYQGPYYCVDNKKDNLKAKVYDRLLLPFSKKDKMRVATKSILATEYIKSKGIKDVTTIGVGLDVDKLQDVEFGDKRFVDDLIKSKGDNTYLLYVGKLEERRNIIFMLEMFSKIVQKSESVKLIIVGNGKTEYVDMCKAKIKELHLIDNIIYEEKVEQSVIKSIYEIADLFILPTRYEIFGMVLLEAMYFGVPVVTTYNGGSCTIINESNGIIIRDLDTDKWCDTILSLLNDKEKIRKMGNNAHQLISTEFTWEALSNKFLEVYLRHR